MALNYDLTLSNDDTIAMYVSNIFSRYTPHEPWQGVDFVCRRSRSRREGTPLRPCGIQLILVLGASLNCCVTFLLISRRLPRMEQDCGAGGWVGDFPAGKSWCEPFKTCQTVRSPPFPRCPP